MIKEFKIRASASGNIMGVRGLGKTGESYLQEWVKEQIYDRKKFMTNKYVQKGLIMEDESIDFIAEHLGYGFLAKNEQYFENEYFTGTPDLILKDHIIDVKNSYDCFTFPLFYNAVPSKDYYWQAQVYMALCDKESYKLIYTLMSTPEELGDDNYDSIDSKYRIKVFDIKRNQEDINKLIDRVKESRDYIKQLNF